MIETGIVVHWTSGDELIFINPNDIDDGPISVESIESWSRKGGRQDWASYKSNGSAKKQGEKMVLRLRYEQAEQEDPKAKEYARWGASTIEWTAGASSGKATWKDDGDSYYNGEVAIDLLYGNESKKRNLEVISRFSRPDQAMLRKILVSVDGRCAISGETQLEALEVAHIRAVKNEGAEHLGNAILLRADLHKMFDAGLFAIETTEAGPVVRLNGGSTISTSYAELFGSADLSRSALNRVRAALKQEANS